MIEFVEPGAIPDTVNILLYGPSGCGKSTAAASAPSPILYLNADGPDALRYPRRRFGHDKFKEIPIAGAASMNAALLLLREPDHGIRTVVLDTLSSIYTVLLEEKAGGGRPSLPMHGDVGVAIERFVREVRDMPVNMILLAQDLPLTDEASGVIERLPYTGTKNPAAGTRLIENMTIVGFCGRHQPQDGGKPRYMATLIDMPGRRGKDRTDSLGAARVLDLSEWIATAAAPVTVEIQEAVAA